MDLSQKSSATVVWHTMILSLLSSTISNHKSIKPGGRLITLAGTGQGSGSLSSPWILEGDAVEEGNKILGDTYCLILHYRIFTLRSEQTHLYRMSYTLLSASSYEQCRCHESTRHHSSHCAAKTQAPVPAAGAKLNLHSLSTSSTSQSRRLRYPRQGCHLSSFARGSPTRCEIIPAVVNVDDAQVGHIANVLSRWSMP
jgi:hypothetical protein